MLKGLLRRVFPGVSPEIGKAQVNNLPDTDQLSPVKEAVTEIRISRQEVEDEDIGQLAEFIRQAMVHPAQAKKFRSSLTFSFYGFDGELLEMMNNDKIGSWASLLLEKFPYLFYFLNDGEYPMTHFVTSLVVTTVVKNNEVYYDEQELQELRHYIQESLRQLAAWLGEEPEPILEQFARNFK